MNKEELLALCTPIIEAGFADDKDDNQIKGEILAAGVDFGKINPIYKEVCIDLGLIVDPVDITKNINELVTQVAWEDYDEFAGVQAVIDQIVDKVEGAKSARVLNLVRAFCKGEEIELPKKPRTGSGGPRTSKVAVAVVELINSNANPTKQDFYDAIFPVVGGDKRHSNVLYYMNIYFAVCLAVKSNTTLEAVGAVLATQAAPEGSDEQVGEEVDAEYEDDEEMAA